MQYDTPPGCCGGRLAVAPFEVAEEQSEVVLAHVALPCLTLELGAGFEGLCDGGRRPRRRFMIEQGAQPHIHIAKRQGTDSTDVQPVEERSTCVAFGLLLAGWQRVNERRHVRAEIE